MAKKNFFFITGARGVGKTLLASQYTKWTPEELGKVIYVDSEDSASKVIQDMDNIGLSFGKYVDTKDRFDIPDDDSLIEMISRGETPWVDQKGRGSLIEYWDFVTGEIASAAATGKYKVLIIDTGEKFEASMVAYVESNSRKMGVTSMAYGKLFSAGVYPLYESWMHAVHASGIDTLIMVFHLKTPWANKSPVPGKVEPGGKPILDKYTTLNIWLVNGNDPHGAPAGLVLKERMGETTVGKDGYPVTRRKLPHRIPVCTWQNIRAYLKNGCDLQNPASGETPSPQEIEMISQLMSKETMRLMIKWAEQENPPVSAPPQPLSDEVKGEIARLKDEGLTPLQIRKNHLPDISLKEIIAVKGQNND